MDKTAIQSTPPPAAPAPAPPEHAPREKPKTVAKGGAWYWVRKGLTALASLRLTVFLFVLALVLVFAGTLAEVDNSLHVVLEKYFRCYTVVWIPLDMFTRHWFHMPGSIPFPGGWLIGGALMANLLAAHLVRFKLSWRRAGIIILHAGIVVLFVGEFIAGIKSVEGRLTVKEGQWMNYLDHTDHSELAIIDPSDPKVDKVVVIPDGILRKGGTIQDDRLPFDIEVVRFMANSEEPKEAPTNVSPGSSANPADAGEGRFLTVQQVHESRGTDDSGDFPSAYVTFRDKKTHESLGTYLTTVWWSGFVSGGGDFPDFPQRVKTADKRYDVSLRFKRTYKPYSIYLYKFDHDDYPGTDIPRNFASTFHLVQPDQNEDRDHQHISMNSPLRYRGETFYQAGFLQGGQRGTVLQVVRNPGWQLPYWACGIVAVGMLLHFGVGLYGFLQRRART
jgi:hypothetical protein